MIGHRLNSTLTVHRPTVIADGAGGGVKTFSELGTIRAQVSQPSAQERLVAAQAGALLTHVVHVANGEDVQRGDELDTGTGRRLRVLAATHDSRNTYLRLDCEQVQGE